MSRYPIDAFPLDGEGDPFLIDADFNLFGVSQDGYCVTNASRSAPYEIWLSYSLLDALIHWRGRWFVGKLATCGVGGSNDLCPIGAFSEITGGEAGRWFCSMERFGRIPPEARALFAKRQALDADATTSIDDQAEPAPLEARGEKRRSKRADSDAEIEAEWQSGDYPDQLALAEKLGITLDDVKRARDRHRKAVTRETSKP